MLINIAQAAGGLAMLYFGGDRLVRGAAALATQFGISPLAVGLTVVAFGTSAPEFVVSVGAALSGENDIAVGNIVGSNIVNIALILGLAAIVRPMRVEAKIVRFDAPVMIVASLALAAILVDADASRVEGILLLAGAVTYTVWTFWESRRESKEVQDELASAAPDTRANALASGSLVLFGLILLVLGGRLLVTSAVALAMAFGISSAVIGLTIVALGTSLPELTTSLVASVRGQGDIAVGNVIGSNIFNVLGILGCTAVVSPLAVGAIGWVDVGAMVVLACVATVFLLTGLRLERFEGAILVAGYAGYTLWLFTA